MHLLEKKYWENLCEGQEEAFAKLYDCMAKDLFKYGYRICDDAETVQDSIQDLFFSLWKNRYSLTKVNSPRFYLFKSLRNRLIRQADFDKHFSPVEELLESAEFESQDSIEEQWISEEEKTKQMRHLTDALSKLTPRQQEFIQLRYYHDFTSDEIAKIMNINPQSIRNLHFRTLQQLRTELPTFSMYCLLIAIGKFLEQ